MNDNLLCSRCNNLYPFSEFREVSNASNGRTLNGRRYFYWCRQCEKKYAKCRRKRIKEDDYLKFIYTSRIKQRQKLFLGDLIEFERLEELWTQQAGLCYWTLIPMIRHLSRRDALSVSVDRLDNAVGYKDGNVVLCCQFINVARQVQSPDEFSKYLENFINFITSMGGREKSGNP